MSDHLDRLAAALTDRYRVEREIGRGGMATVYLAEDLRHHRKVAVKVLQPELAAALGAERFLREIEIAAQLNHPHIVPLHDSGQADEFLYYVMPYVEGESLRDQMDREGQLGLNDAIRIAREVADGLGYAHGIGVVHRDVKPENILTSGEHAVIADFGLARAVTEAGGERLTQTGLAMGTPAYMSPEQATAEEVDVRTDVYALGSVLYEMLAGEPPYTGPTVQAILAKRILDPVPSVRRLRETVPAELDQAVTCALAKAPADRFQTAEEFAEAISAPSGEVLAAHRVPARRPRARRVQQLIGASLAAVIAIGAWVLLRPPPNPPSASSTRLVVLPFSLRGNAEFTYLGDGMVDLLSTKLDGGGTWRSVDPRAVFAAIGGQAAGASDLETGRTIAQRLDAGLYVLGNIVEVGGKLRFDASLYDRSRGTEPVVHASAEGNPAQVLDMVDELAGDLLRGQGESEGARLTQIALVTTHSLPALKAYLRGMREYRAAQFPEAAAAFQEAVAAESTFALAWYQLSVTADWMVRHDLSRDAAEQAVRFADRLSERDRRLLNALLTLRRGEAVEAERLYRAIVGTYPDEVEAWFHLGEVLAHFGPRLGRPLTDAREPWERLLVLEPELLASFVHLARFAANLGDVDGLDSLSLRVLERNPGGSLELEIKALRVFSRNDAAARDRVLAELQLVRDDWLAEVSWVVAVNSGDLADAQSVSRLMIERGRAVDTRVLGHLQLAYLALAQGQWVRAKAQLAAAQSLDPVAGLENLAVLSAAPFLETPEDDLEALRAALVRMDASEVPSSASPHPMLATHTGVDPHLKAYLLGLLNARLGREADARRYATELEQADGTPETGSLLPDLAHGVRATIAINSGGAAEALAHLDQTRLATWHQFAWMSPFYSESYERYLRAWLLQELDQRDEALRWYSSFGSTVIPDLPYRTVSHLRRGEIYERMGDVDRALQHYARFVELWKDADPELSGMMTQARQRIAALAGEPIQ